MRNMHSVVMYSSMKRMSAVAEPASLAMAHVSPAFRNEHNGGNKPSAHCLAKRDHVNSVEGSLQVRVSVAVRPVSPLAFKTAALVWLLLHAGSASEISSIWTVRRLTRY